MNALLIDEKDNVVVVTEDINTGDEIVYCCNEKERKFTAVENITIYHKAAIKDINKNDQIIKYGCPIGRAIYPIHKGEHVHCHNIVSPGETNS